MPKPLDIARSYLARDENASPVKAQSGPKVGEYETPRVLLVDDEENILTSLKRLLRLEHCELRTATGGKEALDVMEKWPADLIVSDQRMPGMTGVELLREIRRRWPKTIRIILSGYTDATTIINAINQGEVYKFITKPWNDEEIKLHLRRAIEQNALQAENERLAAEILRQNEQLRELNTGLDQRVTDTTTGLACAQHLLENLDAGVLGLDTTDMVVMANNATGRILTPSPLAMIGQCAPSFLPEDIGESLARLSREDGILELRGQCDVSGKPVQWGVRLIEFGEGVEMKIITLWEAIT